VREEAAAVIFAFVLVIPAADGDRERKAGGHDNAGRPDLDVELDGLARGERLDFVVRVVRAIGEAQLDIELAVRCAKPSLSDWRVRVERALEHDFLTL
jgi:hypothetical protein